MKQAQRGIAAVPLLLSIALHGLVLFGLSFSGTRTDLTPSAGGEPVGLVVEITGSGASSDTSSVSGQTYRLNVNFGDGQTYVHSYSKATFGEFKQYLEDLQGCFFAQVAGYCGGGSNSQQWESNNRTQPASFFENEIARWVAAGRPKANPTTTPNMYAVQVLNIGMVNGVQVPQTRYQFYGAGYTTNGTWTAQDYTWYPNPIQCPAGSVFLAETMSCVTSDVGLMTDGKCNVRFDSVTGNPVSNPFDPDCAAVASQFTKTNTGTGTVASVAINNAATGESSLIQRDKTSGNSTVTHKSPTGDGYTRSTAVSMNASGQVTGTTASTVQGTGSSASATPLPAYVQANSCGGPGQPVCAVTADTTGVDTTPFQTPAPVESGGKIAEAKAMFSGFVNATPTNKPPAVCPPFSWTFTLFSYTYSFNNNFLCQLLNPYFNLIQSMFSLIAVFLGIRRILSA